jgi:hypothetical protein
MPRNDYYYEAKENHESCIWMLTEAKEQGYTHYTHDKGEFIFREDGQGRRPIEEGLKICWA